MFLWDLLASYWFAVDYDKRGNFGDEFGPVGILLSGITFFLLVLSTIFQRSDLKAQTEALRLQQTALEQQIKEFSEQKEEMARAAAAQERANELSAMNLKMDVLKQRLLMKRSYLEQAVAIRSPRAVDLRNDVLALLDEMEKIINASQRAAENDHGDH